MSSKINKQLADMLGMSTKNVYKFTLTVEVGKSPEITLWQWLPPLALRETTQVQYKIVPVNSTPDPKDNFGGFTQ